MASFDISNKVAIVTGSSSGLGEAIAIKFASQGAKVVLCGRDPDRLKDVLQKVVEISGGHSDKFLTVEGDLRDKTVRRAIIDQTVEKFGHLDILVANAGLSDMNTSIHNTTDASYNTVMDTNVKSVFFLIQNSFSHLQKAKGNIVIISSVSSTLPSTNALVYAISKTAIDHLTHVLAVDFGAIGVRVNSVNPGFIPTRILRFVQSNTEEATQHRVEFERSKCALQDRDGTPEDVAEAVAFLASDAAKYITGQNIKVDGGRGFGEPNGWNSRNTQDSH